MQHLLHLFTDHITPRFIREKAENIWEIEICVNICIRDIFQMQGLELAENVKGCAAAKGLNTWVEPRSIQVHKV